MSIEIRAIGIVADCVALRRIRKDLLNLRLLSLKSRVMTGKIIILT